MSPIITVPHPVLRQVAKPVERLDKKTAKVITDMLGVLRASHHPQGVGLAAIQLGIPLQIFLIRPDPKGNIAVFVNPQIIKSSQRQQPISGKHAVYEGCLSVPHHYAPIRRSMSVTVKYQTPKLETDNWKLITKQAVFSGFPAHIIQHEMDHLNGILFIDRALEQNSKLYHVTGRKWEEVGI